MSSFTENIALFPLKLFLLPGDLTQLYIFEDRYKQLINECDHKEISVFGIAFSSRINTGNYGCLVELDKVIRRYPGGEMDVIVKANSVFKLEKFNFQKEGKLYPGGDIVILDEIRNKPASDVLMAAFKEYLLKYNRFEGDYLANENLGIFDVANELKLNDFEKLELVEMTSVKERDAYLINYLCYLEFIEEQEQSVQNGLYLN